MVTMRPLAKVKKSVSKLVETLEMLTKRKMEKSVKRYGRVQFKAKSLFSKEKKCNILLKTFWHYITVLFFFIIYYSNFFIIKFLSEKADGGKRQM